MGTPNTQKTVGDRVEVEHVIRLTELQHDVVGDVDDRVDRSHAKCDQPVLDPLRGLADCHVVQHARREPAAELRVDDLDRRLGGCFLTGPLDGTLREAEWHAKGGGQVAGHTGHRHRVGTVGVHLEVVEHVLFDAEHIGDWCTQLRVIGVIREQHDAVVVIAETNLGGRAAHAVAHLAAHLALRDLHAVGHDGANRRERDQVTHAHVERATADLQSLAVAGVDLHELDLVGVGMRREVENLGEHDAIEALPGDRHLLDRQAERAECFSELDGIAVDVGSEFLQPGKKNLHQNCLRKRTSLLTSSRMSSS